MSIIHKSVDNRALKFEKHLDSLRDDDGLVFSETKADELRPWRNEDLIGKGYDIWDNWKKDFAGCLNYEDTLMSTGRYVNFKVLKYLATGDESAITDAEHSVEAILSVSKEGDKVEDGLLPKPFSGLKEASKSTGISNDQYEHALFALWSFRQVCQKSKLIPQIESAIVRWTEYFIRRDFCYIFHGYYWVCADQTEKNDGLPVSVGRHSLGLYFPMCVMCYDITGEQKYKNLVYNRLLPSLKRLIENPKKGFSGHSNSCNLLGLGAYFCWGKGFIVDEAKQTLEMCWEIAKKRLSRYDGLEYEYAHAGASDDNPLEPHYLDMPLPEDGWKFGLWVSNVKTASSTTTAHTGMLLEKIESDSNRFATIKRIIDHYKNLQDFARWVDPDGKQLLQEQAWHTNTIPSVFIGAWLQAYYLMNLPKDIDGL